MVLCRPQMRAHGRLDVRAWLYLEGASIMWFKGSTDPLSDICGCVVEVGLSAEADAVQPARKLQASILLPQAEMLPKGT
jgi:hypothetical protein